MKPVDVVLVGMGFTGAILAKELADAGLSVVGLERGIWCDTVPDFQSPAMHDELRYAVRGDLFQNMAIEAMTFRNTPDQEALPMRSLGSFLPGTDVGGAGVHWKGQTWRFLPSDFVQCSHYLEKYGPNAIPEELTIQDWRVTYDDLEPFYDRFEYLCGICGRRLIHGTNDADLVHHRQLHRLRPSAGGIRARRRHGIGRTDPGAGPGAAVADAGATERSRPGRDRRPWTRASLGA